MWHRLCLSFLCLPKYFKLLDAVDFCKQFLEVSIYNFKFFYLIFVQYQKYFFFNFFRWLIAYRDALSFRASHYFISYTASALLVLSGFPLSTSMIVKPLYIEFPHSLVQVVIYWNIPMHYWLKTCKYKILIQRLLIFV